MPDSRTLSVSAFKAQCLDILSRVGSGQLERVELTRHGRVIAIVTPPPTRAAAVEGLFGCLKDQTVIPDDFDLTEPLLDELPSTADGVLHR